MQALLLRGRSHSGPTNLNFPSHFETLPVLRLGARYSHIGFKVRLHLLELPSPSRHDHFVHRGRRTTRVLALTSRRPTPQVD